MSIRETSGFIEDAEFDSALSVPGGTEMTFAGELISNAAFSRSLVLGAFGGIALVLTVTYSRRGPLIFPVYAALLTAVTLLLAEYRDLHFGTRIAAALAAFFLASTMMYVAVWALADQQRRRLVAERRMPGTDLHAHPSTWGHAWRVGMLVIIGTVLCAGIAFVSS